MTQKRPSSLPTSLERGLLLTSVVLGAVHAWAGRYSVISDGISYLDVGDCFFRRDWAHAVNAYWSPLYSWALGMANGIVRPSPQWEFPLAHLVNFAIYVAALLAFRFLLHELITLSGEPTSPPLAQDDSAPLPAWAMLLLGYSVFWWTTLEVQTLYLVTPDLAVLACVCLIAATLLRVRRDQTPWRFAAFGLALGLGYWTKTVLFPLGVFTLAAAFLWKRSGPSWGRGMAVAGLVFLCVSAPLVLLLSHQKGRFTFGDSGRINYAWWVNPKTPLMGWQGDKPGSGHPVHPLRQILQRPEVLEFDGPVAGTYPPWADPSYWNEGLQWHFSLQSQLRALVITVPNEIRLLALSRPDLLAGIIVLALLGGGPLWWTGVRALWPLAAMSLVGLGAYLPILEIDRYLGGFALLLYLVLLAAVRLRPEGRRAAAYATAAVFATMTLAMINYTGRLVTHHVPAFQGIGPTSALPDVLAAEQLAAMGVRPGTKIAIVGAGDTAFWAHLAKLRIVAQTIGPDEFWAAPEETRQNVYRAFARTEAKLVVSTCPLYPPEILAGWRRVDGTPYCMLPLPFAH